MKFAKILVLFLFITVLPSFAYDVVKTGNVTYKGKIFAYSDGLIQIKQGGADYSITRAKNGDFYGDYIQYMTNLLSDSRLETYCRVSFIDRFNVNIILPDSTRIHIPRYRVKSLVLDAI